MRVLLLTDKPPWPADSGGAFATLGLIRGLSLTGNNVTIVTLYSLKHPLAGDHRSIIPDVENIITVFTDTSVKPVQLLSNWFFSRRPYNIERFRTERFESSILPLRDTEFDLAIFDGLKTTLFFQHISKLKIKRIIYRPHNIESEIWKQLGSGETNQFKRAYYFSLSERIRKTETEISFLVDGIAAMTENDLTWFKNHANSKPSTVVSPGIPLPVLPDRNTELHGSVAWIGSLDWIPNIKGLEWFVKKVWPLASELNPGSILFIAGRNPQKSLERRLKGDNIHFSGPVHSSCGFLADKSVIVTPLFAGSGVRIKILEAMSLGKPVVSTSEAAKGTCCHAGKDILIEDDPVLFAGCITDLLKNPQLRQTLGDNARENVRENYGIFETAEKLIKFHSGIPDAD